MLSVMTRHLNSFFFVIESFWELTYSCIFGWDFIDNDNFEGQRSNVLKYPSDYLIQPPGKPIHHERQPPGKPIHYRIMC